MDWRGQNENKTLSDTQVRSQNTWDERYSGLLRRMDDYQEEKDNPRKQVVDMEMEELYVPPPMRPPLTSSLFPDSASASSRSSISMSSESYISTRRCAPKSSRSSTT
jgi:hypothetical protein